MISRVELWGSKAPQIRADCFSAGRGKPGRLKLHKLSFSVLGVLVGEPVTQKDMLKCWENLFLIIGPNLARPTRDDETNVTAPRVAKK